MRHASIRAFMALLLSLVLAVAVSPRLAHARRAPGEVAEAKVVFHTDSGEAKAGCTRSFLYDVPAASTMLQGEKHGAFGLKFTVARSATLEPVISSQRPAGSMGSSSFDYCYNAAYLPLYSNGNFTNHALLVRCQNLLNASVPYAVGPSYLALAIESPPAGSGQFLPIKPESVVFQPTEPYEDFGTEDPRVVYAEDTGLYYLFYSAVATEPPPSTDEVSRLSLALTTDPRDIRAWKKLGPIIANNVTGANDATGGQHAPDPLANFAWSKSGALWKAPAGKKSLLIFGDSSIINGVQTAAPSDDFLSYSYNKTLFLPMRSDNFDSALVESGPPPLQLKNGMLLFLYNSAQYGYPSAKPGWDVQYNVGFALLDGTDPTTILLRSSDPILSPELGWEIGLPPYLGLTPNVVFVEGARLDNDGTEGDGVDRILFWYGAADSTVGTATITVQVTTTPSTSSPSSSPAAPRRSQRIALE